MDCEKCDVLGEEGAVCSRLIRPEKTGVEIEFCPLHAAASELLKVCYALIDCQREKEPTAFNMRYDRAVQNARTALAKAKGGAQ